MYIQDLALNNPQGLVCHKTQPTNQPTHIDMYVYIHTYTCIWMHAENISKQSNVIKNVGLNENVYLDLHIRESKWIKNCVWKYIRLFNMKLPIYLNKINLKKLQKRLFKQ